MLSIAESLSWAELKHRSTPITKRCLPSMSIMIRLPLVLRYRTYVIVIFFNFKWIQFASGQFKLYKTSWCARYHTEFTIFIWIIFKIFTFFDNFRTRFRLMTFSYFFQKLKMRLFAVKMVKIITYRGIWWSLVAFEALCLVILPT